MAMPVLRGEVEPVKKFVYYAVIQTLYHRQRGKTKHVGVGFLPTHALKRAIRWMNEWTVGVGLVPTHVLGRAQYRRNGRTVRVGLVPTHALKRARYRRNGWTVGVGLVPTYELKRAQYRRNGWTQDPPVRSVKSMFGSTLISGMDYCEDKN